MDRLFWEGWADLGGGGSGKDEGDYWGRDSGRCGGFQIWLGFFLNFFLKKKARPLLQLPRSFLSRPFSLLVQLLLVVLRRLAR